MNIGDTLIWGLRLLMIGICLYGLLTRKRHIFNMGLGGLGGSMLGWATTMILSDPFTGLFVVVFGLALIWFANGPTLLKLWNLRKRKGYWIQINDQKFRIPPGVREVEIDVYIEFLKTANPARKVEKTMAPKKGENEEDYRKRMR